MFLSRKQFLACNPQLGLTTAEDLRLRLEPLEKVFRKSSAKIGTALYCGAQRICDRCPMRFDHGSEMYEDFALWNIELVHGLRNVPIGAIGPVTLKHASKIQI